MSPSCTDCYITAVYFPEKEFCDNIKKKRWAKGTNKWSRDYMLSSHQSEGCVTISIYIVVKCFMYLTYRIRFIFPFIKKKSVHNILHMYIKTFRCNSDLRTHHLLSTSWLTHWWQSAVVVGQTEHCISTWYWDLSNSSLLSSKPLKKDEQEGSCH